MNVSELYNLTYWVHDEIIDAQIPQKYQKLQQILQRNTQPNQEKQPFESQKNNLIETLKRVPLSQLSKEQVAFLETFCIAHAIGKDGVNNVNDILYKKSLDVATAAQKIQETLNEINQGIQKSNQIKTGLDGCVLSEEYEKTDEVMIRVNFSGHASMDNVTDFKKWGNIWHEIVRGIAMAHNASPEDIKIIGATKGSVIIEMATIASIATTASFIIFSALKLAEKVLEIKKKQRK